MREADSRPQLDHERLDVYQIALQFQSLVPALAPRRGYAALRAQIERASASVLLNIAEGAGRFGRADKAQFYRVARGSALECAAVLDIFLSRGLLADSVHGASRGLLVRVAQMLTRLVRAMER